MASKIKKYSKKILCMLSAGMFFVMAVFYPFEEFRAETVLDSGSGTQVNLSYVYNNSNIGALDSQFNIFPGTIDLGQYSDADRYTFFYYSPRSYTVFKTSSDYYAYRVIVHFSNIRSSSSFNCHSFKFMLGNLDEQFSLDGVWCEAQGYNNYWYVTDFSDNIDIHLSPIYVLYEYYVEDQAGALNWSYPAVSLDCDVSVIYVPYTVNDLTDEIYSTLQNVYSTNQSMLTKLEQIYTSVDIVETKLQSLVNIAQQIETNTDELEGYVNELEGLLFTCNSYLASIKTELENQTSWLEGIWYTLFEYFGLQGDDAVEEMPSDDMNNMLQVEGELLGDASADDLQNNLKVTIDANSSAFIWDVIDDFVTANSTVFGGFISILSLGVVALILNR